MTQQPEPGMEASDRLAFEITEEMIEAGADVINLACFSAPFCGQDRETARAVFLAMRECQLDPQSEV